MSQSISYRGREFTEPELAMLRQLIAEHPKATRAELARHVCELFSWRAPDGRLKEMSGKVAMLQMERDGLIKLPKPRARHGNHKRYQLQTWDAEPETETLVVPAGKWVDLRLVPVVKSTSLRWNDFVAQYHYLGFQKLTGAQLRYFVCSQERVIALLGFSAAAWKVAPRDSFIGWSDQARKSNLHRVVQNARFLILPWLRSPNLASRLLAMACRQLPDHWEERYHYRPVFMVPPPAAN